MSFNPTTGRQSRKPTDMTITETSQSSYKLTRLQQLERLTYTIILSGTELCALAQLTRMVGGMPNTTYRKYTQPLADWFRRQDFLFDSGIHQYFNDSVITARNLPE